LLVYCINKALKEEQEYHNVANSQVVANNQNNIDNQNNNVNNIVNQLLIDQVQPNPPSNNIPPVNTNTTQNASTYINLNRLRINLNALNALNSLNNLNTMNTDSNPNLDTNRNLIQVEYTNDSNEPSSKSLSINGSNLHAPPVARNSNLDLNINEIQISSNVNNEIQFNNELQQNNANNVNDINNNDTTNIQHINPEIQLEVLNILSNSDVVGNVVIPQIENQTNQSNQINRNQTNQISSITNTDQLQFDNNIQFSNEINIDNQVNHIESEYPSQSSINVEGHYELVNLNTLNNNNNNNNITNAINATGEVEISPASLPENIVTQT